MWLRFCLKREIFSVILAPKNGQFVTYRLFTFAANRLALPDVASGAFSVKLINTGLAEQFIIHMKASMYVGVLFSSPYTLFRFVSPALCMSEKKYAALLDGGYLMFMLGVALSYFFIFPLTFPFWALIK